MNIRPLTNQDLFTVIGLLKKVSSTTGNKLTGLFSSVGDAPKNGADVEDVSVRLGLMVLGELYDNLIEDLKVWFASLCGVTVEEYMTLPAETTIDVIEQLTESEDTRHFFSRALQLYKKMGSLGSRLPGKLK